MTVQLSCVRGADERRYRLGKPSREYQSQIGELMECVSYAKKIQLFMVDVVGTEEEVEADNVFGLDFLLEMMTDSALDRGFIEQHGNELFELLKELHMDKNLRFMTELVGGATSPSCHLPLHDGSSQFDSL